jgi:hypothetical protein
MQRKMNIENNGESGEKEEPYIPETRPEWILGTRL